MGLTAIFGGTFNPPHIGHYQMLAALENRPEIEEIRLMPDKIPPHKVCDFLADDKDRIEMCRLIADDFTKARLCLTEFEREGKSYTYDTVTEFRKKYPQREFTFVCGGDMLISFKEWYRYKELMKMISFTVFRRTDTDNAEFDRKAAELSAMGMKITVMSETITAVSSTYIRNNIEKSRELLPEKIYNYIKDGGIYGGGK
ncbi:MAG: nicotinate (nicotinamide) nucleotide adenylyltransferase [Acutalibacteraceae bacterium]